MKAECVLSASCEDCLGSASYSDCGSYTDHAGWLSACGGLSPHHRCFQQIKMRQICCVVCIPWVSTVHTNSKSGGHELESSPFVSRDYYGGQQRSRCQDELRESSNEKFVQRYILEPRRIHEHEKYSPVVALVLVIGTDNNLSCGYYRPRKTPSFFSLAVRLLTLSPLFHLPRAPIDDMDHGRWSLSQ